MPHEASKFAGGANSVHRSAHSSAAKARRPRRPECYRSELVGERGAAADGSQSLVDDEDEVVCSAGDQEVFPGGVADDGSVLGANDLCDQRHAALLFSDPHLLVYLGCVLGRYHARLSAISQRSDEF